MATIREYFDTDPRVLTLHADWSVIKANDGLLTPIIAKIALDFESNSKYWYFYVPPSDHLSAVLTTLIASPEFAACRLRPDGDGIYVEVGHADYSERQTTNTLQFTGRAHLYLDTEISHDNRRSLVADGHRLGFFLSIRDREYARKRSESEKPLAFISHDSRDKDKFVRELAHEMTRKFCTVWYDEYSLKVGNSLRSTIERGLKETKKCILILSKNFLANEGWGKAEFDSVFTREILERENVILPVWLDVDVRDVFNYSPRLSDKVGLSSSLAVKEVARRLANEIKSGN